MAAPSLKRARMEASPDVGVGLSVGWCWEGRGKDAHCNAVSFFMFCVVVQSEKRGVFELAVGWW